MLCEDNTAKLLGLEDVIVNKVWEETEYRHIEIELPRGTQSCPRCGKETSQIHDYRKQIVKDISSFGKNVKLHLRKRRYACPECGKRFFEKNGFLPRYHRMTNRKNARIIEDFRDTVSATYIAKNHDISVSTALRYFDLVDYSCKTLPEVLSIDEFRGNAGGEKFQTIITDAENRHVKDILPNRKESDLIRYFCSFSNKKDVRYFVMDMNGHFKYIAETCFPRATIVIDRFHVVRQVLWAMERVRKEVQKELSPEWRKYFKRSKGLLNKNPEKLKPEERERLRILFGVSSRLEQAYYLKNSFLLFMKSPDSKVAAERLKLWILQAENAGLPEFDSCTKAFHNWSRYILNAFDVPYSNGFTEGCNNKTKVLKRVCYGVRNFPRFRNRILHAAI